jgi:hypothetical protein
MKRTVLPIALALITVVAAVWYMHRVKQQRALESGDVYVRDQATNTNSAAPANPSGSPTTPPQETATNSAPSAPGSATQPMTQPHGAIAIPASDTVPRNPPAGMAFAGAGKYQLYRQGDITWRLNTDTGQACIIFATDTQWSRPRVYSHGCGAS